MKKFLNRFQACIGAPLSIAALNKMTPCYVNWAIPSSKNITARPATAELSNFFCICPTVLRIRVVAIAQCAVDVEQWQVRLPWTASPLSKAKSHWGCINSTHTAKHFYCKNCGIYTHHQRRSNPNQYGFNIGCLNGVNPFNIDDIPVNDGVNHPVTGNHDARVASTLGSARL